MGRSWGFLALALVVGVLAGLSPQAAAQGGGTVVGEVKFVGTPPGPKVVKVNKDNQACVKAGAETRVTFELAKK